MRLSFHVVAAASDRWDVRESEASGPSVSRHSSLEEAKERALQYAAQFGGGDVVVHEGGTPLIFAC